MRKLIAVAATLIFAAVASGAAAAGGLPKLATGFDAKYKVRPQPIYYTGDSSGLIGQLPSGARAVGKQPGFLRWKTWNRMRAYAVGTLWLDNCLPSCAGGTFHRYPLTLTATRPRGGRFSTMTLHYTYRGKRVTDVRCDSGHGYFILPPDWPRSNDCLAKP